MHELMPQKMSKFHGFYMKYLKDTSVFGMSQHQYEVLYHAVKISHDHRLSVYLISDHKRQSFSNKCSSNYHKKSIKIITHEL